MNSEAERPIRVLIADESPVVLQGLKATIHQSFDLEIVGEAHSAAELVPLIRACSPDVVILDFAKNLVEVVRAIHLQVPGIRTLVSSQNKSREHMRTVFESGASGFLAKEDDLPVLAMNVRSIHQGKKHAPPGVTEVSHETYRGDVSTTRALTSREKQILQLIAEGKSSKDIAELLRISPRTVSSHRSNITKKLNVRNVAGLVRYAFRSGLMQTK
jgi:DNA-binding NarL/FixJ family response regulator